MRHVLIPWLVWICWWACKLVCGVRWRDVWVIVFSYILFVSCESKLFESQVLWWVIGLIIRCIPSFSLAESSPHDLQVTTCYFKTLSVGPAGVELTTSCVTARCSTNWATGARLIRRSLTAKLKGMARLVYRGCLQDCNRYWCLSVGFV